MSPQKSQVEVYQFGCVAKCDSVHKWLDRGFPI